jgi:hypothetical protein
MAKKYNNSRFEERINWFEYNTGIDPWVIRRQKPSSVMWNREASFEAYDRALKRAQDEHFEEVFRACKALKNFYGDQLGRRLQDYIIFGD